MKGRENLVKKAPSTDLLVCFPSRAHLALMPKPICSPARAIDSGGSKRHRRLMKSRTRSASSGGGGLVASPLLWAKNKQLTGGSENAEPTSPKVTCAGQIKVRHKGGGAACKSWQSVMEEIERIHRKNKKKKSSWVDSFGLKKEVMQFLTCLRNIRFDFRCFGSIPQADITSDEEDELEEEIEVEESKNDVGDGNDEDSRAVFSKWYMVLEENENDVGEKEKSAPPPSVPPPNALLLMRCRSAPAKSWLEEKKEEEAAEEEEEKIIEEKKGGRNLRALMEEETKNSKNKDLEKFVMMKYDTDFYKISSEIAKETWVNVGGGITDPFSRSRSWKR
ncbi:uncharacterized protein [Euphorbia lathyris]|uniref:uncharacterized protein n=1 Tax=Euphorbia lathyris TaxID=212925 RepID=UPI003313DC3D